MVTVPYKIFLLMLCACVLTFAKSPDLILKSANSNTNTMAKDGEMISILTGNVVFLYDDATIKSQYAKWWKTKGVIAFSDQVIVLRKTQTMTSDRLDYDKNKKQMVADGRLDFRDSKDKLHLKGDRATYMTDTKLLTVDGHPVFNHIDTVEHDTLVIVGKKMIYDDSLKKATVQDNVTITKGNIYSHSDLAVYYPDSGRAKLRMMPKIALVTDSLFGDSVDMFFTKKILQKVKVKGKSHGQYRDNGKQDTTLTHLYGDSLTMFMTDSGKVDSILAFGNVKSSYFPLHKQYQTNEVYGKTMTVSFTSKGQPSRVRVWGNARSIYNVDEHDGRGINEASGDSILVAFANGKATHVKLSGSVRGFYAPLPSLPSEKSVAPKPVAETVAKQPIKDKAK